MNAFSKDLIESLTQAVEHAEGKSAAVHLHVVEAPNAPGGDLECRDTNSRASAAFRAR